MCNSSISEEDSGFISSEPVKIMQDFDDAVVASSLLDNVQFVDEDESSEEERKEEKSNELIPALCEVSSSYRLFEFAVCSK